MTGQATGKRAGAMMRTDTGIERADRADRATRAARKYRRGTRAANDRPLLARAERHIDRASLVQTALAVVAGTGVDMDAMLRRRPRGRPARLPSEARKLALYLTAIVFDVPVGRLARSVRVDHRDVSRWLHQIEDRRDDPAYDLFVTRLEAALAKSTHENSGEAAR